MGNKTATSGDFHVARWTIGIIILAVIVWGLFWLFTPPKISVKLHTKQFPLGAQEVTLRALENANLDEVIATTQLPATVTDDYLKTTWKLPKELRHRSFIVEVCTTDAATDQNECWLADQSGENQVEREGVYYSCPYYVSAIKASWLGKLTGNNDVELDSRVYCSHLAEGADEFSAKRRGARSRGGQVTELEAPIEGLKFDEEGVLVYKDGKLQTVDSSSLYSPTESDKSAESGPTIIKQYYPVTNEVNCDDCSDSEPQTLKLKGRKLKISDGNSVTLPLNDANNTNNVESQTYPLADGSTDGILSATDWNRFANKENSLTFDSSFMRDGDTIHLMTCPAGQIMKSTGAGFTCAEDIDTDTDTDTQYLAGSGLVLTGNTFSLDQQGAADGQVLMWDDVSNSWSPATPATFADTDQQNLSYNPATGTVSIERGTGFSFPLSGGAQTNPSLLTVTDWATFNGKENVLTFADGLTRTGNNVQLMSCAADQVLQRNGAGNAWICANQVTDTNTTYTAGTGLSLTGTTFNNTGILGVSSTGALTTNVTSQNAALTLSTTSNFIQTGNQLDLSDTGVTAGTYNNLTVDEKGRVTAATNVSYLTSEQDGIIGNEVAGVVNNGGLVMTGAGTTADPYRVGLVTTCADGEILKYTTAGGWACATDIDTTIPDDQTLTYNPANNQLTIADGNTVDLSSLNNSGTDDQQLSLAGNTLTLEDGGTVDLTPYLDNTDTQDLSLVATPGTGNVVNSYQINLVDGGNVTLEDTDTNTQYAAGDGLSLSAGNVFAVNAPTCAATEKLSWDGTSFQCTTDIDTDNQQISLTTTPGTGDVVNDYTITLERGGAAISFADTDTTIADDQTLSYDATTHTLSIADGNSVTFPLASATQDGLLTATDWATFNGKENVLTFADGLTRTGNNVQLMSCAADQVLQRNGAGNAWICANQVTDTNTTYTAGTGIAISGTNEISNTGILGVSSTGALITNVTSQNAALTLNTTSNFTQTGNQLDLSDTGVTAGTYNNVTVDEKGRVTAATNVNYLTSFTEQDGIIGNEVAGVVNNGGLVMTGAGTAADPYRVGLVTTCADGEILKYTTTGGWACATDVDTTVPDDQTLSYNPANNELTIADGNTVDLSSLNNSGTDDQQLTLSGNTLTLEDGGAVDLTPYLDNTDTQDLSLVTTAGTGNVVNSYQINLVDGGNVTLQDTDTDTQYAAGNGLSLSAGNVFAVNAPTCTGTDKLVWNGTQFLCSSDVDTDTTYTAGSGLALAGTTFALSQQGATNGQVLTWNGSNWVPATPATFTDTDDQTLSFDITNNQLTIADGNTVDLSSLNNSGTDDQQLSLAGNTLTLEDGGTVDLTPYLDNTDTQDLSLVTTPGTGNVVNSYQINLVDGGNVILQDTDTQYTAGDGLELTAGNVLGIDSPTCTSSELLSWDGTDFQCIEQNQPPIIMPIDLDLNVCDVGAGGNGQANMHRRNYIAVAQDGQGFIHLDFRMKNDTGGSWNNPMGTFDSSWQILKLSEIQTYEGGFVFAGYTQGVVHGGSQLIGGHRYVVNIPVFVDLP